MSANVGTVRATMVLDDSQFKVAIREAKRSVKELTENMKSMVSAQKNANSAMASWANSIKHAKKEQSELSVATRNATTSISTSAAKLAQNTYHITKVGAAYSDASKKVTASIKDMQAGGMDALGTKTKQLTQDIKGLSSATQGYSRALGKLGSVGANLNATGGQAFPSMLGSGLKGATSSASSLISVLPRLVKSVTVVFSLYEALKLVRDTIRGAADDFLDFQKQSVATAAVLEGTASEIVAVTRQARELSKQFATSATDISRAQEFLAKAGLDANEVFAITPAVMRGAAAAGEDTIKVAATLTGAMASLGVGAGDAADFVDMLTAAAIGSKADLTDFGVILKYAGATAKSLGVNMKDLSANAMALMNAGFQASEAGSKLRNVMVSLVKPTREGSAALKELNIDSTTLATEGITGVVRELQRQQQTMDSFTFNKNLYAAFGKITGPAMAALVSQGTDAIEENRKKLNEHGIAAEKAEEKTKNFRDQWTILTNNIHAGIAGWLEATSAVIGLTGALAKLNNSGAKPAADGMGAVKQSIKEQRKVVSDLTTELDRLKSSRAQVELGDLSGISSMLFSSVGGTPEAVVEHLNKKISNTSIKLQEATDDLKVFEDTLQGLDDVQFNIDFAARNKASQDAETEMHQAGIETAKKTAEEKLKLWKKHLADKAKAANATEADQKELDSEGKEAAKDAQRQERMLDRGRDAMFQMQKDMVAIFDEAADAFRNQILQGFQAGTKIFQDGGKELFLFAGRELGRELLGPLMQSVMVPATQEVISAGVGAGIVGAGAGMAVGLPPEMGAAIGGFIAELLASTPTLEQYFNMVVTNMNVIIEVLSLAISPLIALVTPLYLFWSVIRGLFAPFSAMNGLFFELVTVFGEFIAVSVELWMWTSALKPAFEAAASAMRFMIDMLGLSVKQQKAKLPKNNELFQDLWDDLTLRLGGSGGFTTELDKSTKSLSQLNEEIKGLNTSFRLRRRIAEITVAAGYGQDGRQGINFGGRGRPTTRLSPVIG